MTKRDDWVWHGHACHFICGDACLFHMATVIGGVVVSTIGDYFPLSERKKDEPVKHTVGYKRYFETMVFRVTGTEECGCPDIDPTEIDMEGYQTAPEAHVGHMAMCEKWAALDGVAPKEVEDDEG